MDTLQTNHRPLRPIMDPHLHQQQQQPQPPQVPMGWYPGQFQYQTTPPQPQPPQHHHQQWAPEHYGQGFNPQEMYQGQQQQYPQHQHQQQQHHPLPPPPRPHHQVTNMYAQPDQAWTNPGWSTQQTWDFTGNNNVGVNNEEDWAAKARAWAASKAAMEAQQAQPQFAPPSRASEHHHVYQGHYSQPVQAQYPEVQQQSVVVSSRQSVQPSQATIQTTNQIQDSSSHFHNEATSSYNSDNHMLYGAKDAAMTYAENASAMPSQGSLPTSSTSYTQEIPFSYTSVPGVEEQDKQRQISNSPLSSPMIFQQDEHVSHAQQQSLSTTQLPSQSLQPHIIYSDQQVPPVPEICHPQPGFEHVSQDYHQHQQSSYVQPLQTVAMDGQEYNGQPASAPGWPQLGVPNPPFPSVPPSIPSNHQFEQPYGSAPLPIHGHTAQLFGRVPGPPPAPGFRPSLPPIGGPFVLGPGSPSLPPGPAGMVGPPFMGENSGAFGVPERPKKASVPSWLREELMKKKAAVVANASTQGHSLEDAFRTSESEDENHSFRKADMDIKSDSQHASDDEDIEEDEVEAARMVAINQEIKRVLTDVLLKVTDDLFSEIALEIVEEDSNSTQVKKHAVNDRVKMKTLSKASSPTSPVHPSTVSAKVVVSANNIASGIEDEDDDVNSSSSQPGGNLLGLANYVSDDDDDDDDGAGPTPQQFSSHVSEHRESSPVEEHGEEGDGVHLRPHEGHITEKAGDEKPINGKETHLDNNSENSRNKEQAKDTLVDKDDGSGEEPDKLKLISKASALKPTNKGTEKSQTRLTNVQGDFEFDKRRSDNSKDKEIRSKGIDKTDARKSTSVVKTEDGEMRNRKGDNKEYDSFHHRKDGEKGEEREREKDREKMKEREKNRATDKKRDKEKVQEREARKDSDRTHEKERRKEYEKEKRTTNKTDNGKRNEKERAEKNFPERQRDSKETRKRRKRSSSVSSRGRNSKVDSYDNYNSSGPEGTENTRRRKVRSSRHSSSPSPVRSRKRQVSRSRSRSPHARHFHRRHSPYPSHEGRRKQSPSGSPVRRRRHS